MKTYKSEVYNIKFSQLLWAEIKQTHYISVNVRTRLQSTHCLSADVIDRFVKKKKNVYLSVKCCLCFQVVGLYRLCGSAAVKKELREAFERDSHGLELCESTYPDVNVITGKPTFKVTCAPPVSFLNDYLIWLTVV